MRDAATLILANVLFVCLMVPAAEHFGGRTLPPGFDMIFFWMGAIGLATLLAALGLLRLFRLLGWQSQRQ